MTHAIKPHLAQQIVEAIKDLCEHDINFIDSNGIIFASTNQKRIGDYHEIGRTAARTAQTIEVEQDQPASGVQKGVNIPFMFHGEVLAVIGISGNPEQVRQYARLAQRISALIFREHELDLQEQRQKAQLHQLLRALVHNEYINPDYLQEILSKHKASPDTEYRSILVRIRKKEPTADPFSSAASLETQLYQVFGQTGSSLYTALSSDEYLLLLKADRMKRALPGLRQLAQNFAGTVKIGIGKAAAFNKHHQSYSTAVLSLNSLFGEDSVAVYDDLTLELLLGSLSAESKNSYLSKTCCLLDEKKKELLKVYFSSNNSLKDTCEKLYIHKNTLQYQLDRIHQITGFNPREFQDAVILYLALKLESAF